MNTKKQETCKQIEHTPIKISKPKDNLQNLRTSLELLLKKININKIIIKPADKGSTIIATMAPNDYWNMCYRPLSDIAFYNNLENNDLSAIVQEKVNKLAEKYK